MATTRASSPTTQAPSLHTSSSANTSQQQNMNPSKTTISAVNPLMTINNQNHVNQTYANVLVTSGEPGHSMQVIPHPLSNDVFFLRDYYTLVAQHMNRIMQMNIMPNQSVNSTCVSTVTCFSTSTTQAFSRPLCASGVTSSRVPIQQPPPAPGPAAGNGQVW